MIPPASKTVTSAEAWTRSAGGAHGAGGHDPRDVRSVVGRRAARIELDAVDQVGMNDRQLEPQVKQLGHANAVQEEAGVARVGAAHHVERRRPGDLRDARQRAEHAQRITGRAGQLARLLAGDLDLRDLGATGANLGGVAGAAAGGEHAEDLLVGRGPGREVELPAHDLLPADHRPPDRAGQQGASAGSAHRRRSRPRRPRRRRSPRRRSACASPSPARVPRPADPSERPSE